MKVIIMDDDRAFSDLLKKVIWVTFYAKAKALARQRQQITDGLEIQQFDTHEQALDYISSTHEAVDLIFTEIHAADKQRYDFIKACQERHGQKYGALIIVAERGRQQDIDYGMSAGAQDFLLKPFTPEDLIKFIFAAWDRNQKQD
ncbi:response regulator [candidate division FCPU426 bacterium]|nr:response regulator [candidate division FCPU426 bacterium]